jgi:hypothetical protein
MSEREEYVSNAMWVTAKSAPPGAMCAKFLFARNTPITYVEFCPPGEVKLRVKVTNSRPIKGFQKRLLR